jgi:mycothiol system anti-sigma-R factor
MVGSVAVAAWPCDAILERSYEFLDGELSPDADALIREHLAQCRSCRLVVQRDSAFLAFLERRALIEPAPPELRERITDAIEQEGAWRGGDEGASGSTD